SDAVNLVLDSSDLQEYKEEIVKKISFTYSNIRKIEYECLTCNIEIVEKIFDTGTMYKVKSSKFEMDDFLHKVKRLVKIVE
ncbi:MAG: YigZ family protein, partial [Sulfurimonas sp.]|nr:YigZ family protein [Sulfurimonas sp.]